MTSEALSRIRDGSLPAIIFQGLAGSGKATLLSEVARRLTDEFPYALVIKFNGPAAFEPIYILEEINNFLIAVGRGIEPERLGEQNPHATCDSLISQFIDLRVLVLLVAVDAVQPAWLNLLLQGFAALPQVRIIATAIRRPEIQTQAYVLTVPPLTDREAVAFAREYARIFNVNVEPEYLIKRLPASIRNHPQALTTVLAHLRDVPLELLLFEGIPEDARTPVRLIEQAILLLDNREKSALAVTELLAEVDLANAFRALAVPLPAGFVRALQVLTSRSLVYLVRTAYSVPAIVSEALGGVAGEARSEAASSIVQSLRQAISRLPESDEHLGTLAQISARVTLRLKEQRGWELIRELAEDSYLELLNMRGYWKEYSLLLRVGVEAAERLNDEVAKFRLSCALARKLLQMGEGVEAHALLKEIEKYQGAEDDSLDRAEAHSHRALLYTMEGDEASALRELAESRRIRTALGDSQGLALTEILTGNIYIRRREYPQARQAYEAALGYFGDKGSRYIVDVETSLAVCDFAEGLTNDLETRFRKAMAQCQQLNYYSALPRVLYYLALVLESSGRSVEAADLAREAAEKGKTTDQRIAMAAHMLAERLKLTNTYMNKEPADG